MAENQSLIFQDSKANTFKNFSSLRNNQNKENQSPDFNTQTKTTGDSSASESLTTNTLDLVNTKKFMTKNITNDRAKNNNSSNLNLISNNPVQKYPAYQKIIQNTNSTSSNEINMEKRDINNTFLNNHDSYIDMAKLLYKYTNEMNNEENTEINKLKGEIISLQYSLNNMEAQCNFLRDEKE